MTEIKIAYLKSSIIVLFKNVWLSIPSSTDTAYICCFVNMCHFVKNVLRKFGGQRVKGGPNPREGYKSASGLGPGGPNPPADLDRGVQIRGVVKIRCDTGPNMAQDSGKCKIS